MSQLPGSSYTQLLNNAQGQYSGILSGYQTALSNQVQGQQGIEQGYNQLYGNVLGGIQNVRQSQSQAIADQYAQQVGSSTQGLVNAGLGNTTVTSSVGRGLALDQSKAQTALSGQFAQLQAGYQSQLGLAALAYRGQAQQQNSQLQQAQLGYQGQWQGEQLRAAMSGHGQQQYGGGAPVMSGGSAAHGFGEPTANPYSQMPGRAPVDRSGQTVIQPDDPYVDLPPPPGGGIAQGYGGWGSGGGGNFEWAPEEIPYGGGYDPSSGMAY